MIWISASAIVLSGLVFMVQFSREFYLERVMDHYLEILLAVFLVFFPFLFRSVFGRFPLETLRERSQLERERNKQFTSNALPVSTEVVEKNRSTPHDQAAGSAESTSSAVDLLAEYAHSSQELSTRIFSRAGVYLIVGVMIAFLGLIFFYIQTAATFISSAEVAAKPDQATSLLLPILVNLLPKFGVLFFIEFVAFFFLRQYRAAMEDFRYYEAIKRHREESLVLHRLAAESGKPIPPLSLVKEDAFFSRAGILNKGQTSEYVEGKKLEKSEIDLLEKIVATLSRPKK